MGEGGEGRRSHAIAREPRRFGWEARSQGAVQTGEVLEEEEPAKEPPEMSDVEQALITLMDCTKSTASSSKQHELFLSLQTRVLNERTSKKLAATP
jgi:hypothetical protein